MGAFAHQTTYLAALIAFLLFNIGYGWAGTRVHFETRGAKFGAAAVALNLATMVLPPISPVFWSAVSLCGVTLALVGAALLFKEARRAPA
jgi:hypothetical protein